MHHKEEPNRNLTRWSTYSIDQSHFRAINLIRVCTRRRDALAHLARAIELEKELVDIARSPELAELYIARGQCELALGHRSDAQIWLDAARAIHATHPQLGPHLRRPLQALQASLERKTAGLP